MDEDAIRQALDGLPKHMRGRLLSNLSVEQLIARQGRMHFDQEQKTTLADLSRHMGVSSKNWPSPRQLCDLVRAIYPNDLDCIGHYAPLDLCVARKVLGWIKQDGARKPPLLRSSKVNPHATVPGKQAEIDLIMDAGRWLQQPDQLDSVVDAGVHDQHAGHGGMTKVGSSAAMQLPDEHAEGQQQQARIRLNARLDYLCSKLPGADLPHPRLSHSATQHAVEHVQEQVARMIRQLNDEIELDRAQYEVAYSAPKKQRLSEIRAMQDSLMAKIKEVRAFERHAKALDELIDAEEAEHETQKRGTETAAFTELEHLFDALDLKAKTAIAAISGRLVCASDNSDGSAVAEAVGDLVSVVVKLNWDQYDMIQEFQQGIDTSKDAASALAGDLNDLQTQFASQLQSSCSKLQQYDGHKNARTGSLGFVDQVINVVRLACSMPMDKARHISDLLVSLQTS